MYTKNHPKRWILLLFIVIAVLLGACARQTHTIINHDTDEMLAWPLPPNQPRIKYIGALSHPKDLGIHKSFMDKLSAIALGEEDNSMVLPMAVVDNGLDQLYVADPGVKAIHRFDRKRGRYSTIKRSNGKSFQSPVSLAADNEGNVYIVDSELAQLFIVGSGGTEASPLDIGEDFVRPTGITIDSNTGWFYVVDTGAHKISVFNPEMTLLKKIGLRGSGDGEFNFPTYIWQDKDGDLLVTDSLNFRIQRFDREGNYIDQFGKPGNAKGSLSRPKGVAVDSHGHVYVVDSLFHNIQLFNRSGALLMDLGKQGSNPGEFWLPVGIHISGDDTIYICDSYNKRVQVFQYIGTKE